MAEPMHVEAIELVEQLLLPFYLEERDMLLPNQPEGQRRNENDAEHSWSLGVLACTLAHHIDPTLDVGRVAELSLAHDLVEVHAKDTSVWAPDEELGSKEERESESFELIAAQFAHFPWLIDAIREYEDCKTNEARYVKSMDKYLGLLIRFMDGGEFFHKMGITKEVYDQKLDVHRVKAQLHPGAAEYYEKIRADYEDHPEHFAEPDK